MPAPRWKRFVWMEGEGIPVEIQFNERDHRQPFPGDGGIRFEPYEEGATHPMADDSERN